MWWTLLTIDTWNSAALCIPRTIQWRNDTALPCNEWTYLHDPSSLGGLSTPDCSTIDLTESHAARPQPFSVLGHKVKLNLILYEIIKVNMTAVADEVETSTLYEMIRDIEQSLEKWLAALPPEWHYTEENLLRWTEDGMGRLFMSVHLDHNHACQLLYFQFLYLSQEPGFCNSEHISYEKACEQAQKCKHHASTICQLISDSRKQPGTDMCHALLGHLLSISSAAQIHTLLFNAYEDEIKAAKARLEQNFASLARLHQYWPNVGASFSRLEAFHNECLQSKDSSFRLNNWMLQFILEFSRPIRGRTQDGRNTDTGGSLWSLDRIKNVLNTSSRN